MHLGSQKQDAYRSLRRPLLVGCENSEREACGPGGKPRTSLRSAVGLSVASQSGHENSGASYIGGWEEEGAMACSGSSDLQLLRISREAQKLNRMIDSWSKSPSFDGRSTGVAAELLRGALDLQESLLMLGRLQGASNFMAETRRKQNLYAMEEEEIGEVGMEFMGSRRFGSNKYMDTLQEERIPVDGSSRNCREELKKVIKSSLHRQNLVSAPADDEIAPSGRSLRLPQRNGFGDACGEQRHKTQCSGSAAAAVQKNAKAPNLIARLMGLEESPSESQPAVRSKPEGRKNPVQPRHFFDIEMPKAGKPPSLEEQSAPEQGRKTLQEIIEAMQFKGLLRADRSEEAPARSLVEQYFRWLPTEGEAPPIVIIKPMHSASVKVEEAQRGLFIEAKHASTQEKGKFSKEMEEVAAPKLVPVPPKQIKNIVERSVGKDKVEAPYKNKISAPSHLKHLKKETSRVSKKSDEMQRPVPDRGKLESRNLRSVTVSRSQAKTISSTPVRKAERRPVQVKNHVSTQTSSSNHEDHRSTRSTTRKPIDTTKGMRTTKARPLKEPTVSIQVDSSNNSKEENKETIPVQEKIIPAISSTLASNLLPKERESTSIISKRDTGKDSSFHCEVMPKRSHGSSGNPLLARAPEQDKKSLFTAPAGSAEKLKQFLLSSPSFVLCAQELFNIHHHQPADFHRRETKQMRAGGSKLLLDCSTELITSKSHRLELLNHPLSLSYLKCSATNISIDQLVDEISEEIEHLRGYSRCDDAIKYSVYEGLERDLKCNRVSAHVVWDWGWIEVVPVEEADRVVCDVEKLVLNALIEETAVEFMC